MLQPHSCSAVKVHPAAKLKDETYGRHLWGFRILRNPLESVLHYTLHQVRQLLLHTTREATAQVLPFA